MALDTVWSAAADTTAYPRPQMIRGSYVNLDGLWDYKIVKGEYFPKDGTEYDGKIRVPFALESPLSGVGRTLGADESLVLRTVFDGRADDKFVLHIGAADFFCIVYLNGKELTRHTGGYTSFSAEAVAEEKNELICVVRDPSDQGVGARGKQRRKNGGIWYTPQSGIWQSVWLEYVPDTYVTKLKITPDISRGSVNIKVFTNTGSKNFIMIDEDGRPFESHSGEIDYKVLSPVLWSPETPRLYHFDIMLEGDRVRSYFALREFGIGKRADGMPCFTLNGEPYFMTGLLDQGYWPDGIYTPPSDEALIYDIKLAKKCGFNTLRKHAKVEIMRFYYHCDRLGMIVWQDIVNGGGKYDNFWIMVAPTIGINIGDGENSYGRLARTDAQGRKLFEQEMTETVEQLYNCPCIALWTLFNEAWGQFDSERLTAKLRELDGTGLIDSTSGWYDQGAPIRSIHRYILPFRMPKKESRHVVLSEYGGYSMKISGHVYNEKKTFGYLVFRNKDKLNAALGKLLEEQIVPAVREGLCAAIYTQLSDVENEQNGLVTYDRKELKADPDMLAALNAEMCAVAAGAGAGKR